MKKVLIALGSTGGHIFPGISILNHLESIDNKIEVKLVNSIDSKVLIPNLTKRNEIYKIKSTGFVGKSFISKIKSLVFFIFSIIQSLKIIFQFKPEIIIGTGGFVSLPIALAGYVFNKKIYIAEGNSVPGLSNRIISKFCDKIFINFEESEKYFKKNMCVKTGFPIRKLTFNIGIKKDIDIFILGGSQGSAVLNEKVTKTIYQFLKRTNKERNQEIIRIVHQSGSKNNPEIKAYYKKLKKEFGFLEYEVYEFIENIDNFYQRTKILISRAGASTIAESLFYQIPTIYFPITSSSGNHQYLNAKEMVSKNFGLMCPEDITPELFSESIFKLLYNKEINQSISGSLKNNAINLKEDSASKIIKGILNDKK